MGCGEKKATHLITQVQLRLRNGQAVFPQPLKAVNVNPVRTACGSGRFRFVNWQIEMSQFNRPPPQTVLTLHPNEASINWRCLW